MLLTVEQPFVLMCLDALLGGAPDRPPRERRFSEIDWTLTGRLFDSIVQQLTVVWEDLAGVTLGRGEIETHSEASQIASVSEPTFVVMIESTDQQAFGSFCAADPVGCDRADQREHLWSQRARRGGGCRRRHRDRARHGGRAGDAAR